MRVFLTLLILVSSLASCMPSAEPRTLLLVGFRPFVGREANVGEDTVNLLDGRIIAADGHQLTLRAVVLPVEWGLPEPRIQRAIQAVDREGETLAGILIIGESDEPPVTVNKGATNQRGMDLIDFGHDGSKTPGQRHLGEQIVASDPLGNRYLSTLFQPIQDGLTRAGVNFVVAEDSGLYLCAEVLYVSGRLVPAAGMLHIPRYPVRLDNREHPENAAHLKTMRNVVETVIGEIARSDTTSPLGTPDRPVEPADVVRAEWQERTWNLFEPGLAIATGRFRQQAVSALQLRSGPADAISASNSYEELAPGGQCGSAPANQGVGSDSLLPGAHESTTRRTRSCCSTDGSWSPSATPTSVRCMS